MSKKLWVKFSIFLVTNIVKITGKLVWTVNKPIFWEGPKSCNPAYNLPRTAKYMYAKFHCDCSNGLGVHSEHTNKRTNKQTLSFIDISGAS